MTTWWNTGTNTYIGAQRKIDRYRRRGKESSWGLRTCGFYPLLKLWGNPNSLAYLHHMRRVSANMCSVCNLLKWKTLNQNLAKPIAFSTRWQTWGGEMITALRGWQGRSDFPTIVVRFWCLIIVLHKLSKKAHMTGCWNGALKMLQTKGWKRQVWALFWFLSSRNTFWSK